MRTIAIAKKVIKELLRDKTNLGYDVCSAGIYYVADEPHVFS